MKPKSRKEILNANAFKAGKVVSRLRSALAQLNDVLGQAGNVGIAVEIISAPIPNDPGPDYAHVKARLSRGKSRARKTLVIDGYETEGEGKAI